LINSILESYQTPWKYIKYIGEGIIVFMNSAIFLDRDGVIIENRANYVRNRADVHIYPQALEALKSITESQYKIVIVTNQSVVGRGFITIETANEINNRLVEEINKHGGRIDGVYMCPHAPEENCSCRKPQPGLLLEAAHELSLDLKRSIMIGDALSDLQAGQLAEVDQTILVLTGRGTEQVNLCKYANLKPFQISDTLSDAWKLIKSTTP
jgi:D-glycero-D-manno-heptose 1,7-bisphosphate phosphatase